MPSNNFNNNQRYLIITVLKFYVFIWGCFCFQLKTKWGRTAAKCCTIKYMCGEIFFPTQSIFFPRDLDPFLKRETSRSGHLSPPAPSLPHRRCSDTPIVAFIYAVRVLRTVGSRAIPHDEGTLGYSPAANDPPKAP